MKWKEDWTKVDTPSKEGGQGTVSKVQNKTEAEQYGALKEMHESQASISTRRARFASEIEALQKINNDGVPSVLEFSLDNPGQYLISAWVEGEDLHEYSERNRLSIEDSLRFTRQLALIVDHCHQNGIVHRDIKPQNIRVRNGDPVLVDFGLSWTIDEKKKKSGKTPLGEELGNRFLRLPELTAGSTQKHEQSCDVTFVVGILFYLVCGKPPRQLNDSESKMPHERLTDREIEKLSEDPRWTKINRVFNVGFQQSSALRFESCIDLVKAIDRALSLEQPMDNQERLDESKRRLSDLINTSELKERRAAVENFKKTNDKLYKEAISVMSADGTSVSNNENFSPSSHKKNMYVRNNMFPDAQVILSHKLEIESNRAICSYALRTKEAKGEEFTRYYEGHLTDPESMEEAINSQKHEMFSQALSLLGELIEKNR